LAVRISRQQLDIRTSVNISSVNISSVNISSVNISSHAQPQFSQPQFSQPQFSQPQFSQPQFSQPQFSQPQFPVNIRILDAEQSPAMKSLFAAILCHALLATSLSLRDEGSVETDTNLCVPTGPGVCNVALSVNDELHHPTRPQNESPAAQPGNTIRLSIYDNYCRNIGGSNDQYDSGTPIASQLKYTMIADMFNPDPHGQLIDSSWTFRYSDFTSVPANTVVKVIQDQQSGFDITKITRWAFDC
jgi:hypothetical protein